MKSSTWGVTAAHSIKAYSPEAYRWAHLYARACVCIVHVLSELLMVCSKASYNALTTCMWSGMTTYVVWYASLLHYVAVQLLAHWKLHRDMAAVMHTRNVPGLGSQLALARASNTAGSSCNVMPTPSGKLCAFLCRVCPIKVCPKHNLNDS